MFIENFLMCHPKHFAVKYSINTWMHVDNNPQHTVDREKAVQQWEKLHHTIINLGGYVKYVKPHKEFPDLCFTANGGFFHENKVVLPRFRHKERHGETEIFAEFFKKQGFECLMPDYPFEGAGDAFVVNETLFLGNGFRTDARVGSQIMDFMGLKRLVLCDLVDPRFYHLDTCFCPLYDRVVMLYPGAFSDKSISAMKGVQMAIFVDEEDAVKFVCNSVIVGGNLIVPQGCSSDLKKKLAANYPGKAIAEVEMTEFMKSGGAAKCLTLKLDKYKSDS